jgi:hypothetical protein
MAAMRDEVEKLGGILRLVERFGEVLATIGDHGLHWRKENPMSEGGRPT